VDAFFYISIIVNSLPQFKTLSNSYNI